ncbi:iron chelate uptake ABC transporter family permease subunit [Rathayibacter sp. VKM Ac-2803]|uniref:FecCD family ABC transporter permease n=1 Tax=Rathayibacter sp. VKM Ac-2803 TaxID=2609256 RepID=UPI00135A5BF5|nr:iron chelate uptake ABC transporter family permease subunit [Rathayibacter sp. VKM Ac-2803]MWV49455.1 iron chelate uptake ABC transporter family permease subunit [Rathayibacter sp. VKM Ac-2803]
MHVSTAQAPTPAAAPRRRARRTAAVALVLAVLLAASVVASLAVGSRPVPVPAALDALLHGGTSADALIVRDLRLPRTATGLLVGAALGAAGLLMQAVTRNRLADPGLLGVNAGASAAVVVAIAFFGVGTAGGYVWFAFAGAAAAAVLVHLVGGGDGRDPIGTVLAGVALSACLGALIGIVTLLDEETFESYRFWVVGSLERRELDTATALSPFVLLGLAVAAIVVPALNQLALGHDTARALGVRPAVVILGAGAAITLLCGAATAAAGPLAFVGLLVAHLVLSVSGPDLRVGLPLAVLGGALVVVASDVLGRILAAPAELEVGIVTALVGAPLLFHLATRGPRRSR